MTFSTIKFPWWTPVERLPDDPTFDAAFERCLEQKKSDKCRCGFTTQEICGTVSCGREVKITA